VRSEGLSSRNDIVKKIFGDVGASAPQILRILVVVGLDYIAYGLIIAGNRGRWWLWNAINCFLYRVLCVIVFDYKNFGSEEQRRKYLPKLASGEFFGCFGFDRARSWIQPKRMVTNFKDMGDHLLVWTVPKCGFQTLLWLDIAVVWAKKLKKEESMVLIVERGMEGFFYSWNSWQNLVIESFLQLETSFLIMWKFQRKIYFLTSSWTRQHPMMCLDFS